MFTRDDLAQCMEWLPTTFSPDIKQTIIDRVAAEEKELLSKTAHSESEPSYGYSFPGLNEIRKAFLVAIQEQYRITKKRPRIADIGAGFGNMTWKALVAGADV